MNETHTPPRTKTMMAAGEYWIQLCKTCHHPGGAHRIDQWEPRVTHCGCGGCPSYDYDAGYWGVWSDRRGRELEASGEVTIQVTAPLHLT